MFAALLDPRTYAALAVLVALSVAGGYALGGRGMVSADSYAEIKAAFDADKATRSAMVTALALKWAEGLEKNSGQAAQLERDTHALFAEIKPEAVVSGPGIRLPADVVSVWHRAAAAADATAAIIRREQGSAADAGAAAAAASDRARPAVTPGAVYVYDEREVAGYFKGSDLAYADALLVLQACRRDYNATR